MYAFKHTGIHVPGPFTRIKSGLICSVSLIVAKMDQSVVLTLDNMGCFTSLLRGILCIINISPSYSVKQVFGLLYFC